MMAKIAWNDLALILRHSARVSVGSQHMHGGLSPFARETIRKDSDSILKCYRIDSLRHVGGMDKSPLSGKARHVAIMNTGTSILEPIGYVMGTIRLLHPT